MLRRFFPVAGLALLACAGCRDLSNFNSNGDHFEGQVVPGDFVRVGVDAATVGCLTLDTDHLQDAPGVITTNDGRFQAVPMRPIPQIWHDPLSSLSFGEGRLKNLVYIATASAPFADGRAGDVLLVLSLMQSGDIEVRMIRGAPGLPPDGGDASAAAASNLFAIFDLQRQPGACPF